MNGTAASSVIPSRTRSSSSSGRLAGAYSPDASRDWNAPTLVAEPARSSVLVWLAPTLASVTSSSTRAVRVFELIALAANFW